MRTLLVLAVLVAGCSEGTKPVFRSGTRPPRPAQMLVRHLIARNGELSRASLTPVVAQVIAPARAALPAGARLQLTRSSWRQTGRFANAEAVLTRPHAPAERMEIGFMLTTGGWRVTFAEPTP